MGGLGFREIELFNDAMLAKLAWRLINDPESLLAQTLLGKYCAHSEFLDVSCPSSVSHGWRGILAGREVLKKGLGWLVGDGSSISVWSDPWLSTDSPLTPFGPPTEYNASLQVKHLIAATGEWDVEAIRLHLPQYEEHIRRIILPSFSLPDKLVWIFSRSGTYTTKSGYATIKVNSIAEPANPINFNWKACIWQVNTTPKIKHFLWKSMNGALPVGSVLLNRGIQVDGVCKRCGQLESEIHVLFHCTYAQRVWESIPCVFKPAPESITSIHQLLQASRRMLALPPSDHTVEASVLKIIHDTRAWRAAQAQASTAYHKKTLVQSGHLVTTPNLPVAPIINFSGTTTYTDAAWNGETGNSGLGWHFRDHLNVDAGSFSSNRRFVASALVAEALAVKSALLMAAQLGINHIKLCSDSKSLISLIKSRDSDVALRCILSDIQNLITLFEDISFQFIPRVGNSVADALAKSALYELQLSPIVGE
ncbi:hypothetical protein Bca4012_082668 [Brassica carinata]